MEVIKTCYILNGVRCIPVSLSVNRCSAEMRDKSRKRVRSQAVASRSTLATF